ncbi:tRNA lysidine(34) synthetase TilS [[Clostridium] polysaccharolyticum]|jgi:tRNA(Ile)-lysidine synthase|uniref:tRNA(Ile)-lysidine synthase n=1 Tax=[Clostridium] polysaccharolyticum TaxID=29364 RepID=A0A1I0EB01_9FIRM|nr:tRNA lysidine(34) synthetase TilS [[Clostridium] polysaccharolyticum]SET41586.1 tRNA(Ile)-lysidine synthase [[Clostridium] polysaccharolyticum]
MLKKVEKYIEQYHMIEKGDRIVLGVSGGADSISLFFVMMELKQKYNIEIAVVHVNHGIRGEDAIKDEEYVQMLCRENGILFYSVHADVRTIAKVQKLSEEEAGRKIRYEAFEKACAMYGCNKIAVAHNENDVSETVLLNLFRGSGLKGLTGIEPVRGKIIRPLLCVERREIEQYLWVKGIGYQTDSTNFETEYTRNKIRLQIIPYVEKEINERASEHIAKSASILSEANSFIQMEVSKLYERCVEKSEDAYHVVLEKFCKAHAILKKEVVRKVLFELSNEHRDIEMRHIYMILELEKQGAGKRVDLPYEMETVHFYDRLVIRKKKGKKEKGGLENEIEAVIPGLIKIPGSDKRLCFEVIYVEDCDRNKLEKMYRDKKNDYTKWFDYDKIRNTVLARYRKAGDFFVYNEHGNRKKLKEYFIEQKVPAEKRKSILLLADGNHIMWITGYRISEYYKVTNETKRILKVKIDGGNKHG